MIFNTKTRLAALGIVMAMIAVPVIASAQTVPQELVYEGRMLSSSGQVLTDDYIIRFSFWTNSDYVPSDVNADGSLNSSASDFAGWTEELPVEFNSLGHFSVILGQTNSLLGLNFDTYKYLQVEIKKTSEPDTAYQLLDINGDGGSDTLDRKTVASVPYARHAELAAGTSGNEFIIDPENSVQNAGTGNLTLQFGGTLEEYLQYNYDDAQFELSDSVMIDGDITTSGNIEVADGATVDGIDVSVLSEQVLQNAADIVENAADIAENADAITAAEADILQNAADILENAGDIATLRTDVDQNISDISDLYSGQTAQDGVLDDHILRIGDLESEQAVQDALITQNATDILTNAGAITAAQADILQNATDILANAGDITQVQQDIVTLEQTLEDAIADLEDQMQLTEGSTAGDFILDADNSGGDIVLQFGDTLGETLTWNSFSEVFELSDDLFVDGNIETSGTVDGVDVSDLENTVTTNTTNIAGNTTSIVDNASDILQNAADILANAQDLDTAEQAIIDNASAITQNTSDILTNANDITSLQSNVSDNTDAISTLEIITTQLQADLANAEDDILDLQVQVLENTNALTAAETAILQNAADILANTQDLTAAQQDILNNAVAIAQNTSDIADLELEVDANAQEILDNAVDILTNAQDLDLAEQEIVDNAVSIASNAADILTNAQHIIDLRAEQLDQNSDIDSLQIDTAQNASDILNVQADIVANANDILTNANAITQAESDILANASDILNNASDIAALQTDVSQNTSDIADLYAGQTAQDGVLDQHIIEIDALESLTGDGDFTGANTITFGSNLTEALLELDSQIADNTADIITLATAGSGYADGISDNASDIDDLENALGDTQYTSENIVTAGDDVTTAISDLDAYLGSLQSVEHQVLLGTSSLRADGTNNKVNIYQSTDATGNNPHHYYKVFSKQSDLQDMDIEFKIKLPENFESFEGFTLEYQTDGGLADAALDVVLTDENGNIAASTVGLSSLGWAEYNPVIAGGFTPQPGDYVFITLKAYTKDLNEVRFGDMVLQYSVTR